MTLTRKTQYGLLICLYLARAGTASAKSIAIGLSLSLSFVQQVAGTLVKEGVLGSAKGPVGGFSLAYDVCVGDVYHALNPHLFVSHEELTSLSFGSIEHRSLLLMVTDMRVAIRDALDLSVKNTGMQQVALELGIIDTLPNNPTLEN